MATPLKAARHARGWSKPELKDRMRLVARRLGEQIPNDDSLHVMLARWENGRRTPSEFYRQVFCQVYDLPPAALGFPDDGTGGVLPGRLFRDVTTALLYAAPLTTEQIHELPARRVRLYVTVALSHPDCPPGPALTAGLRQAREAPPGVAGPAPA